MSQVRGIAIRSAPRADMQTREQAQISVEAGLDGDFRGSQQGRQVTLISAPAWRKACADVGRDLPWTTRRANLLIDEIEFDAGWVGRSIRIGEVELRVTRETDPCSRMDEQCAGLTAALQDEWRGGVCCNVINGGSLRLGDKVEFD